MRQRVPALMALLALLSCEDAAVDPTTLTSGLALQIVAAEGVSLAADRVTIRLQQGATTVRTVQGQPGTTVSITGLTPGNYVVSAEGLLGPDVEWYDQTSVTIVAGQTARRTMTARSFVPMDFGSNGSSFNVGDEVLLAWLTVTHAVSYRLEGDSDVGFLNPQTIIETSEINFFAEFPAGTWFLRVRAVSPFGSSGVPSQILEITVTERAPPAAPSNLKAVALSGAAIELSWTDNAFNEEEFQIERLVDDTLVNVATVDANSIRFLSTGLSPSTSYAYRVAACHVLCSSFSGTASATTLLRSTSIADARQMIGAEVTVQGIVTWQPSWDSRVFFFQDETAGIAVFGSDNPDLSEGDQISITGVIGTFRGEVLVGGITEFTVLGQGPPIDPRPVSAEEINAGLYQGQLVRLSGLVKQVDEFAVARQAVLLRDGAAGQFSVLADSRTGVTVDIWKQVQVAAVTGVLGTDDRNELPFRIEVRQPEDVGVGAFLYVSNWDTPAPALLVIDVATNTVVDQLDVLQPGGVGITPDGAFAYVPSRGGTGGAPFVAVFDLSSNTVVGQIPASGFLHRAAITPDGALAYVASLSDPVIVIEVATNTIVATVTVDGSPRSVRLTPDGAFAYVPGGGRVAVIDVGTNKVVAFVPLAGSPQDVAFTPDGAFAYVPVGPLGEVAVIDVGTHKVVASVTVGDFARSVAVTPDGARAYVTSSIDGGRSGKVSVIDIATNTVIEEVAIDSAMEVVITPDGKFAYVGGFNAPQITVIEVATNTVVATITVKKDPVQLTIFPSRCPSDSTRC